ncbi:esterase family protein [Anoxybacterium hadale]|uniref:Esterase family protein n=1 Tax=Anoxybacterium hadale TaxID=3408580 RepID=A0ACD1AF87_9FIRM|nr:esterase family protein [Clostridiales bacterium]
MILTRKKAAMISVICAVLVIAIICLLTKPSQSNLLFQLGEEVSPVAIDAGEFVPVDSNKILTEQNARLIKVENFHAKQLNNDRSLHIYLPPGYYTDTVKRFPVLYVQDGKSVFDYSDWSKESLGMHVTADKLISEKKIQEIIIVGIDNIGEERINEYAHWDGIDMGKPVKGKGLLYENFVIHDVKPFIDQNFRTMKDREHTALMGASIGGLVTFNIGYRHPETFSKLAMMSPYFGWGDGKIYSELDRGVYQEKRPVKLWIDVGSTEEDFMGMAAAVISFLRKNGYQDYDELAVYEAPGGEHSERFWADRVEPILLYFFGDIGKPQSVALYMEQEVSISKMPYGNMNAVVTYDSGFKLTDIKGNYKVEKPELLLVGTYGRLRPLKEGKTSVTFLSSLGLEADGEITVVK